MARKRPANKRSRKRKSPPKQGLAAFAPTATAALFDAPDAAGMKAIKFLVGLALLPFCWAAVETFFVLLRADTVGGSYWKSREFLSFGLGCSLSLVLFYGFRNRLMMWLYVAGHELTHALFVLLCRGKVSKIHITSEGGHVLTNRNNFLISLSPYFFPFYTVLVILGWALLEWVVRDLERPDAIWLYGLIGVTWMFHLTFTIWMIRRDQPDVEQNGKLFSFSLIILTNVILISAMLVIASPTATFRGYGFSLWANTSSLWARFSESVVELIRMLPF